MDEVDKLTLVVVELDRWREAYERHVLDVDGRELDWYTRRTEAYLQGVRQILDRDTERPRIRDLNDAPVQFREEA